MPDVTLGEVLDRAVKLHAAGRLDAAETLYEAVRSALPDEPIALHHLGIIQHRRGNHAQAIRLIDQAIAIRPDAAAFNNRGTAYRALGRHAEALSSFEQALALKPGYGQALRGRGATLVALGRAAEGLADFDAVLAANGEDAETLNGRGGALQMLRRHAEALKSLDRALELQPDLVDALNNRGVVLNEIGRHEEAIVCFDRALALQPGLAEGHSNRGHALMALKRHEEALAEFDRALAIKPGYIKALNNRAAALHALDRHEESLQCTDEALARDPENLDALRARGRALNSLRRYDDALATVDRILALFPDDVEALNDRGFVLGKLNRHEEALATFNKGLALQPRSTRLLNNRGNTLMALLRQDEALADFNRIVEDVKDYVYAVNNRGVIRMSQGHLDEAFANFLAAETLDPGYALAHWNQALCLLLRGDFERGWAKYEWRLKSRELGGPERKFAQPRWTARETLIRKTLLVPAEQGIGDAIQVCRYIPRLAARGARIVVEADEPLASLLARVKGVAQVIPIGEDPPPCDFHCPMMSLPFAVGTRLHTIPAEVPYLDVPADLVAKWRQRLGFGGPKIGIAWAGNPGFKDDQSRSVGLENVLPLFAVPGVRFFSLQKDLRAGDRALLDRNPHVTHLGADLSTLLDTAAIMMSLDLVIAVDTAVAHLAGALGRPVWILLKHVPDWRWLLNRADSPWYPSARLFRQPKIGDWQSVVTAVTEELRSLRPA